MKPLPRIIGLTGRAGVGKDTLADHLVKEHGYAKMALADPIKELLNARFGWTMAEWNDRLWKERGYLVWGTHQYARTDFSPRSWAQWLGTEVGRVIGGEDVWVDRLFRTYAERYSPQPLVISDVRFDNEARHVRCRGGCVVMIERGNAGILASDHASERGVSSEWVSGGVTNEGPVESFLAHAVALLRALN